MPGRHLVGVPNQFQRPTQPQNAPHPHPPPRSHQPLPKCDEHALSPIPTDATPRPPSIPHPPRSAGATNAINRYHKRPYAKSKKTGNSWARFDALIGPQPGLSFPAECTSRRVVRAGFSNLSLKEASVHGVSPHFPWMAQTHFALTSPWHTTGRCPVRQCHPPSTIPANQRSKLTGAAILVSRASMSSQEARAT